jgi:hypothetical protein
VLEHAETAVEETAELRDLVGDIGSVLREGGGFDEVCDDDLYEELEKMVADKNEDGHEQHLALHTPHVGLPSVPFGSLALKKSRPRRGEEEGVAMALVGTA